jgi:DNA-binding NtrC family response regulator
MARILIIEDEQAILSLLRRIVMHMGHVAITASNGPEALALLGTADPNLIISDLRMPGQPSGIDLIRNLRQRCPRLPIIVISGYVSRDSMAKWPELGIDDFLAKPFDMDAIRDVVERALLRTSQTVG